MSPRVLVRARALAALPGMNPAMPFPVLACLLLPVAGVAVLAVSSSVAAGSWRTYPVLATNHLLTLGWGTLVAMGALHQMFPAMLGVSSRPGRGAGLHFGLTVAAVAVLLMGFLASQPRWVAAGGFGMVLSASVLFALLLRLATARRRWSAAATGVLLSAAHFVLTVCWGFLVAFNWNLQLWPGLYTLAGIGVHAVLGLLGWFAQLVVSVSYYLLPRFTGVRSVPERRLVPLLALLNAAVVLFVLAALGARQALAQVASWLLCAAGALYVADLVRFLRGARQRAPDLTNWHWWGIAAQTVLLVGLGGGWAAGVLPAEGRRAAAAAGVLLLCGWVTLAVMGQLYKVTPLLMWYYRYARGLTAYEVPRLPAPYFPRWGVAAFWLTAAGSTLLAAAVVAGSTALARAAGAGWAAGTALYGLGICVSWVVGALLRPPEDGAQRSP